MTEPKPLSLYIHVPFCVQKCNYCDFCSFPQISSEKRYRYVEEVCHRIRMMQETVPYGEYRVETVYFGGGTPTLLSPQDFHEILSAILLAFPVRSGCEITAECNPGTVDLAYLEHLRSVGVNRLSIGLQSANEEELRLLGRIHTAEEFLRCAHAAHLAGFTNLSVDLMFGIPKQTPVSFRASLQTALQASPTHISVYGLKIEDGTPFGRHPERLALPDEDDEETMYRDAVRLLGDAGFLQYEISNFALFGYHSQHNLAYWTQQEYLGFGVAAHSYFRGERFSNSRDFDAFLRGEDITELRETIGAEEAMREYVMLRMRLGGGISRSDFNERFGKLGDFDRLYGNRLREFIRGGFVEETDSGYAFTTKGFRVSNYILSEIL